MRNEIRKCWPGEIFWDCPMAQYSTMRVGGPAEALILPSSLDQLSRLVIKLAKRGIPWLVLGRGSNIIVADQGISGVVIVLGRDFSGIRQVDQKEQGKGAAAEVNIYVEAGCSLAKLGRWCVKHGLSGLEFAAGIPGSLGGSVVMNAGAWGGEMGQVVRSLVLLERNGTVYTVSTGPDDFSYRRWKGYSGQVVVAAHLALTPGLPAEIEERCRQYDRRRKSKQPQAVASAGSFFRNPVGEAAGRLIEQSGLKGTAVGGARVSEVHANFLVNTGGATANDFYILMQMVQEKVNKRFDIELQPEVKFVGRWPLG